MNYYRGRNRNRTHSNKMHYAKNSNEHFNYFIPTELKEIVIEKFKEAPLTLKLHRYIRFGMQSSKKKKDIPNLQSYAVNKGKNSHIVEISQNELNLYKSFFSRLKRVFNRGITLKTATRLVIGMGDPSVFEVSLRLHRFYGVPVIAGSAVKGAARSYLIHLFYEKYKTDELFKSPNIIDEMLESDESLSSDILSRKILLESDLSLSFQEARSIFGTKSNEGCIIFGDAYPSPVYITRDNLLELDVMTPHYSTYYSSADTGAIIPPSDSEEPTPILFITVKAGVIFYFPLLPRCNHQGGIAKKVEQLLRKALTERGIGGKTAVNYGYFVRV